MRHPAHFLKKFLPIAGALAVSTCLHARVCHVAMEGSDGNPGTEKAPWKSVQYGLDRLRAGDTLIVHSGNYEGPLKVTRSGTKKQPIVIQGQEETRIEAGGEGPAIVVSAASRVVLEGFSVDGEILIAGNPEGVVLRANTLRGGGGGTGICLVKARGALIERNLVSGFEQGIVVAGSRNIVRNNIVRGNSRAGIVLGNIHDARETLVRNNTMDANGVSADSAGGLWIRHASDSLVESNVLVSGPGRNLFTTELAGAGDRFFYNLYYSPGGLQGAVFRREGKTVTGFVSLRLATRDPGAVFADPLFSDAMASLHRSSPAIDLSPSAPFPGEKDFSGNPRKTGLGLDAGAEEFVCPTGLHREGNQLVHQNRIVRLRGVAVGDPLLDRRDQPLSQYILLRKNWNANVVRISIHPFVWRNAHLFGGTANVLAWIRRDVDAATGAGHFVILDWHVTGWPDGFAKPSEPGEFLGLHDSSFALACDFWEQVSRVLGKNGAVAFELWNEPVRGPDDWQPKASDWRQLHPYWEHLTALIRRHSGNLILLAGGNWAYSLRGIRELPPTDPNVAFSWHVYAGKENNDESRWAVAFDDLSKDWPVIVSEWGFDELGPPSFRGGIGDFGAKFATNWLEGRNLHWVAWCWHSSVGPTMLRQDWATPTPFGSFVKALLVLNPGPQFVPSRFSLVLSGTASQPVF